MKKVMSIGLIVMVLLFLAACKGDPTVPTIPTDTGNPTDPTDEYWDQNGNGIPDWQEEEITLTYATWQYTQPDMVTIDLLMIEAFAEKYPNINVEMKVVAEWYDWDTAFLGLLEANDLPDVFLIQRLGSFLPFNMLADISEMYENDPSTQHIFESVSGLGTYGGKRFAVPTFIYPTAWFVNLDLLDKASINKPGYDWTYAQMESIARSTTNLTSHEFGLSGCNFYSRVYPKVLKMQEDLVTGRSWYAFGYDGERFNFDDPVMQTGANKYSESIQQGYCKPGFSPEELEEWYADPTFVPTYGGKVAIWPEATWSAKDYFDSFTFNWDVYPGPGGVTGGNTDIGGVSSLSQHKQAAYQLLKWMSFGEDGLLKRFEIYADVGQELFQQGNNFPYPIIDYGIDGQGVNKVWEAIPYGGVAPGFVSPEFVEGLRNGAFWANKEVIGWDAVDSATGPYFVEIMNGTNTYAALKDMIQAAANAALNEAQQAMKDMIGF
jgi:multiple sugar transport system substrate-binding protein